MSTATTVADATAAGYRHWSCGAALMLLLGASCALFWPTVQSLVREWENTDSLTYTHGYAVVAISVWLLWRAKPTSAPLKPELRVLPLLIVASMAWLLAYRASVEIGHQLLLPWILWAGAYAAFGRELARRALFPVAYLYFAIPIWTFGNAVLQELTVQAVRWMLMLTSIEAHVAGNFVHIASGVFEIAGGCSGLHYFIVSLATAALYSELHNDSWRIRLLTMAMAAALAMFANWIRVAVIIVAGYLTDMQHSLLNDHYYFGWLLFAVTMAIFFVLARYLPPARRASSEREAGAAEPLSKTRIAGGVTAAIATLSIGPAWAALAPIGSEPQAAWTSLPEQVGEWQRTGAVDAHGWRPNYPSADWQDRTEYRAAQGSLSAFVAGYFVQHQDKELIGFGNSISGNEERYVSATGESRLIDGLAVNEMLLSHASDRALLLYYYQIGTVATNKAFTAQLLYAWQSLFVPTPAKVVAVYAPCDSDCASERERTLRFLGALDASGSSCVKSEHAMAIRADNRKC